LAGRRAKPPGAEESSAATITADEPHYLGHRDRLRQRFLAAGPDSLADYELLELILFSVIPRKDVKPLAKRLIAKHGSFAGVLAADPAALTHEPGISEIGATLLKTIEAAAVRLARARIMDRPVIASWQNLLDYCRAAMAHHKIEQFRLLFLDRKNNLIADELQQQGTVDHTPVYPREVVKRALELGASALILVHKYPTRHPTSSGITDDHIQSQKRTFSIVYICPAVDE
jgi:DNA repair protein RadC